MTKTAIKQAIGSAKAFGLKAVDGEDGTFEAVVSVFGNVDRQNDRIKAGAFANSLAEWKASGDPIPVVWSHQWDNLDAHVGAVVEAKELLPGDPALPSELATLGALWAKFTIDADSKVKTLLDERRIREFSFAYEVFEEERASDGVNELLDLGVIEIGPTLKGANPDTRLLSASLGLSPADDVDPDGAKARVPVEFEGSIETTLDAVFGAALEWARGGDIGNGGFYALHMEATVPGDSLAAGKVIVLVEGWDDPYGEGIFYELAYSTDDAGEIVVDDPKELEITVAIAEKARPLGKRFRVKSATKPGDPATVKSATKNNGEDPPAETSEDNPEDSEEQRTGLSPAQALLETDLIEIE